jgi:hypothetical protein
MLYLLRLKIAEKVSEGLALRVVPLDMADEMEKPASIQPGFLGV